jgi:NitT/TauT family transport system substrate-binding protein
MIYYQHMVRIIRIFFVLIAILVPQSTTAEQPLKKASFLLQWVPQAQFAGYYVAYEKGIYKKYGIDLTILKGGPDSSPVEYLEKGKADFASIWLSTAIQKRSQGMKLVNIGQIIQRSALMLVAKKARGINKPQDINGKKVGLWGAEYQIQPRAFFKKYNLKVKIIPQSFSVNLFLRDGVDVASAMWYNEYHTILNSGLNPEELKTFFFYDYGLNFPEDGIYTLEKNFKADPSLSCAFLRASIEGWLYAFAHSDEALDIVLKYISLAKIPANRVHQKWMLERMRDLIQPTDSRVPMGTLLKSDFLRVANELKENRLIKEIPDFESFSGKCIPYAEK